MIIPKMFFFDTLVNVKNESATMIHSGSLSSTGRQSEASNSQNALTDIANNTLLGVNDPFSVEWMPCDCYEGYCSVKPVLYIRRGAGPPEWYMSSDPNKARELYLWPTLNGESSESFSWVDYIERQVYYPEQTAFGKYYKNDTLWHTLSNDSSPDFAYAFYRLPCIKVPKSDQPMEISMRFALASNSSALYWKYFRSSSKIVTCTDCKWQVSAEVDCTDSSSPYPTRLTDWCIVRIRLTQSGGLNNQGCIAGFVLRNSEGKVLVEREVHDKIVRYTDLTGTEHIEKFRPNPLPLDSIIATVAVKAFFNATIELFDYCGNLVATYPINERCCITQSDAY